MKHLSQRPLGRRRRSPRPLCLNLATRILGQPLWGHIKTKMKHKTLVHFRGDYFCIPFILFCMCPAMGWAIGRKKKKNEAEVRGGRPYLQHRVATLLVQHGRRHRNHPRKKTFFEVLWFSAVFQAAVVNLFVLNSVCFISVCPCIPETGRLENTYSCWGFWLWSWLAAAVNLFFLICCASSPFAYTRNGQIVEHLRTEKKQKRPCPAVQSTWLHVGPFLAGVLTQRFSTQPLELYISRLSRCTTQ